MSRTSLSSPAPAADLYRRLADAFEHAVTQRSDNFAASGFINPDARENRDAWRPLGELPERLFDRASMNDAARFCLFDGRAFVAVRGGAFTDFERQKLANTRRPLTLIFNGRDAIQASYHFDGRASWTAFPVASPCGLASTDIQAVEIERDGRLLFSSHVSENTGSRNYRPAIWFVNAAGRLSGAANGAMSDVAVEIRVGDEIGWAITKPAARVGQPRQFEFDLARACMDNTLVKVAVFNPATCVQAVRSPVGVFASQGEHFLFAGPRIGDGKCRAVLMSWKDGKRRRLMLVSATDAMRETTLPVRMEDAAELRFDGGDNSFVADLELLRGGAIITEDESGSVLGKLPPLEQILAFVAATGIASVAGTPSQQALVALAQDAVLDKNWPEAARRWHACISCFGAKPHWLSNRAHALFEAGRLADAEREYLSLAQTFPHLSAGMVGLARLAQRRNDWPTALGNWTYCLENFGGAYSTHWVTAKASALREMGRLSEAEGLVREFSNKHPENGTLSAERVRLTIEHARRAGQIAARRDELCEEIEARFPEGSGTDTLIESMRLFSKLGEYDKARQRLMLAAPMVSAPGEIEILFRAASEIVEPGSRGPVWEQLLAAACGRSVELELGLLLALERFAQFARTFDAARESLRGNANLELLAQLRARLAKPRGEVFAERKVFGIGLSRTGTRSLAKALQALGLQVAHWTNPLTFQIIGPTDIYLFDAALDIAVAQDFEKLYYQYPNARFVWTQRPLESWITSVERHYQYWHRANGIAGLRQELENGVVAFGLSRAPIEFGLYLNAGEFGAAYETFERRVRSFFRDKPPEKLLALDIFAGEGWNEICRFLDAPVPNAPFPHDNKGLQVVT